MRVATSARLDPATIDPSTVYLESGTVRPRSGVRYDPLARELEVTALESLAPSVTYRLVLDQIGDLDGNILPERAVFTFVTGEDDSAPEERPVTTWGDAARVLAARCAVAACHDSGRRAGLDLSNAAGVRATAIGAQVRGGPGLGGREYARAGGVLGELPLIDVIAGVGRPEASYLIYKALGDDHAFGEPMPPPGGLGRSEARVLVGWVASGAPLE